MTERGRRAAGNLVTTAVGQALRLSILVIATLALPRLFGAADYGLYSVSLAVVGTLLVVAAGGLPLVEVRFVAPLMAEHEVEQAGALVSMILFVRVALALVAVVGCWLWLAGSSQIVLVPMIACVTLFGLARFLLEAARSPLLPLERVRAHVGLDVLQQGLGVVGFVVGYLLGGLPVAFLLVGGVHLVLGLSALRVVGGTVPLRFRALPWAEFVRMMGLGTSSLLASFAIGVQIWLPVWAVGEWAGPEQAALLGVSVQILGLVRNLFFTSRHSMTPILAQLGVENQDERLRIWADFMMRSSVALCCLLTVGWALLGRWVVALLGPGFEEAYLSVALILISAMAFVGGASCNGLLFLKERPWLGAVNVSVFALVTLAGTVGVLHNSDRAAVAVAAVYALGALLFFGLAYWGLGRAIPRPGLLRTLTLMFPTVLVWVLIDWYPSLPVALATATVFVVVYAAGALALGLFERSELDYVWSLLRARSA